MRRVLVLGLAVLFAAGLGLVSPASAQTRDETLVYALQSDIDNWDPPNSVLREASSSATTSSTTWPCAI